MANFYIKKIVASGKGKTDSVIEFEAGLNIICGPSNTGKSYIIECIDFMFGSGTKPFSETIGYDTIAMVVANEKEQKIRLERQLGRNIVRVSSNVPNIESGDYGGRNKELKLSDLWLSLIGIQGEHKVITNERFEAKALTWRTFLHIFLIKEDNVFQKPSIIKHTGFSVPTAPLSAFLFFLRGADFNEFIPQEKPEIRKAKKRAVKDYINKELSSLSERYGELSDTLHSLEDVDVNREMQLIIDQIEETESRIAQASHRSRQLLEQIYSISAKLEESVFLRDRYKSLRSQYKSDIKRLTFIVEGEIHASELPENKKCPFCDSNLPEHEHESYIEASREELKRIVSQLNDLHEVEKQIAAESDTLEGQLSQLRDENAGVLALIDNELVPQATSLRKSLDDYRTIVKIQNELDVLQKFASNMNTDLAECEKEDETDFKYKPKEHFGSEFLERINNYLVEMLEACNYEHLLSARFSLESFDIVVNGCKKENEGKGFRAFLNTILAFTFMKYLSLFGKYAPKMLIVDSPILSLKERGTEKATDSMKSSLFRYFLQNQNCGQIIIVENDIPELDYSSANVIRFTMDDEHGRYGFLDGVRN